MRLFAAGCWKPLRVHPLPDFGNCWYQMPVFWSPESGFDWETSAPVSQEADNGTGNEAEAVIEMGWDEMVQTEGMRGDG